MKRLLTVFFALGLFVFHTSPVLAEKQYALDVIFCNASQIQFCQEAVETALRESFPHVNFTFTNVDGNESEYSTRIRTLISAGGDDIDIWWDRGGSWVSSIIESQTALDLAPYLENIPDYWLTISPDHVSRTEEGSIYAVPCEEVYWEIIHYRKDIFEQYGLSIPQTVDELIGISRVLAANGIKPLITKGYDGWPCAMMLEGFAYTVDPYATYDVLSGKTSFSDSVPYRLALGAVQRLLEEGVIDSRTPLIDGEEASTLFKSGEAAMYADGSWVLTSLASDSEYADKVDWFYYPAVSEEYRANVGKYCAGGVKLHAGAMVYAGTENPQLATEVAVKLSQEYQKYLCEGQESPFVVYKPDALGWEQPEMNESVRRLVLNMDCYGFTYPFIQDSFPTSAGASMLMEACNKFFTHPDDYSADDLLADLDTALTIE